jgi:hypothetical protein
MGGNNELSQNDINAINAEFSEYHNIQNQLNIRDNIMKENILKRDLLIKMQNDDISDQLSNLDNISSTVSNRSRMLDQSNQENINNDTRIYVLIVGIIYAILLLITVILFGKKILDSKKLSIILIILTIIYVLFLIYTYNIFYLKNAINFSDYNKKQKAINKLIDMSNDINTITSDFLYGDENEWKNKNCKCPDKIDQEGQAWTKNTRHDFTRGYFYHDGTAPQQLLIPTPNNTNYTDKIDWPDYSPNGNSYLKTKDGKSFIDTEDNQYYNYNSKTDPSILLLKQLNKSNTLVNNTTYTANI